jgi:hypothetical protein
MDAVGGHQVKYNKLDRILQETVCDFLCNQEDSEQYNCSEEQFFPFCGKNGWQNWDMPWDRNIHGLKENSDEMYVLRKFRVQSKSRSVQL